MVHFYYYGQFSGSYHAKDDLSNNIKVFCQSWRRGHRGRRPRARWPASGRCPQAISHLPLVARGPHRRATRRGRGHWNGCRPSAAGAAARVRFCL